MPMRVQFTTRQSPFASTEFAFKDHWPVSVWSSHQPIAHSAYQMTVVVAGGADPGFAMLSSGEATRELRGRSTSSSSVARD